MSRSTLIAAIAACSIAAHARAQSTDAGAGTAPAAAGTHKHYEASPQASQANAQGELRPSL